MEQSAEIIADSIGPNGIRVTTMLVNHYRFIHAELLRHRTFSFSVASSRAIPYDKQREQVADDPSIPIAFQAAHKGMQGNKVLEGSDENEAIDIWLNAKESALQNADALNEAGVTKQLSNRLLEPFVNTRAVITATEWDNFFMLRQPWTKANSEPDMEEVIVFKDEIDHSFPAEIHIQELAIRMKQAMESSTPKELKKDEWHLPFITDEDKNVIDDDEKLIKISAARCARTSYGKNIGKTIDAEYKLADMLMTDKHWSPFEHQGQAIEYAGNRHDGYPHQWLGHRPRYVVEMIPKDMELRVTLDHMTDDGYKDPCVNFGFWSRNLYGWRQARAVFDK